MTTQQKLAAEFCRLLKSELTPAEFSEMQAVQSSGKYHPKCCPSHDYCDANMVMDEAFFIVTGKHASDDLNDDAMLALWNSAWTLARANNYEVKS